MSVTFWCPEAPTTPTIPYPDQDPTFVLDVSNLPEVNLANGNARAMLEMLGLPDDESLCGTVEVAGLDAVLDRLRAVLAIPEERAAFLEPTTINGRVVTECGAPATQSLSQLLAQVLVTAGDVGDDGEPTPAAAVRALVPTGQSADVLLQDRTRGATVMQFGRTDPYLIRRAEAFLDLFTQAKANNYRVSWG